MKRYISPLKAWANLEKSGSVWADYLNGAAMAFDPMPINNHDVYISHDALARFIDCKSLNLDKAKAAYRFHSIGEHLAGRICEAKMRDVWSAQHKCDLIADHIHKIDTRASINEQPAAAQKTRQTA